jgi:hypothetical protein
VFKLTTPVAFIIFNRPDTTARVFAEIAQAKPPKLLVIGDGPRTSREGEAQRVAQTRAIIEQVNWPCEVLTNFSDTNMGCRKRVSSGIDWIFQQVEEAIILEDDCLPEPSFFQFCQEMLERYRDDQRIGMISGDNFQFGRRYSQDSYYFSKYVHIWGWATWRNRWQAYDVDMTQWPLVRNQDRLESLVMAIDEAPYWSRRFERVYQGKIDSWAYPWVFSNWMEGRLSITPSVNLISNIGFGADATHTTNSSPLANLPTEAILFPLTHPVIRARNVIADHINDRHCFRTSHWKRLPIRFLRKLYRMVGKYAG